MIYQPGLSVMNQLVARASAVTGMDPAELRGPQRDQATCHVRFAIMMLAREKGLSMSRIARGLGRTDHTTILSGLKRAEGLRSDPDFAALLEAISA
jgi:chromosomal replication initiation ATPase DnaA